MRLSAFRDAILNPALGLPEGVVDPQGRPAPRRFGVYRNNVTVGLTEALRQSFPAILKLVGDEFFTAMAIEHLRTHPPTSPLMMFYGAAMPDFLCGFAPVQHLAYLPDVARLELALRHSYHAADAVPVTAERLQCLPPERLMAARIGLAPAVQLLRAGWPVLSIWAANMRGAEAPSQVQPEDVLITRPVYDPEPHLLPAGAAGFIAALQTGQSFGDAFEAAGPFDLTATLGLMLAGGAIIDLIED
ncbi:MAG: DNA-binding domain-containing protein [Rhodobacteraceae bacterium]|nr:DNA-binding domain-containing protein [Paracoccaceae bacterium]